jgi:hypothetical protein
VSPNLAPTIIATNGGTNNARNDRNITTSKAVISVPIVIKVVPGVVAIGENKVDTTKRISLSGNPGDMKIETTRKTAFNPI